MPPGLEPGVLAGWFRRGVARDGRAGFVADEVLVAQNSPGGSGSNAPPAATLQSLEQLKRLRLEELMQIQISTMSRVDERIDEAPGSVYVYTRDVIQKRGYRSLGELLQTVPGFTVFHRDLQFVAGVRGLNANDNEKITLLINGQNLNGVSEPDFLNGPINLDNVERVEVIVGPSSLFQPANTLAATVNVITKDMQGFEVIGAIGNDLPYSATLMTGKQWAADSSSAFPSARKKRRGSTRGATNHRAGDSIWMIKPANSSVPVSSVFSRGSMASCPPKVSLTGWPRRS